MSADVPQNGSQTTKQDCQAILASLLNKDVPRYPATFHCLEIPGVWPKPYDGKLGMFSLAEGQHPFLAPGIPVINGALVYGSGSARGFVPVSGETSERLSIGQLIRLGHRSPYGLDRLEKWGAIVGESASEAALALVAVDYRKFYAEPYKLKGEPQVLHGDVPELTPDKLGVAMLLLREGDALGIAIQGHSIQYVLAMAGGEVQLSPYTEWRVADMQERPGHYLDPGPYMLKSALPGRVPPSWYNKMLRAVLPDGTAFVGELVDMDGGYVCLKDWKSYPQRIVPLEPLWLVEEGHPPYRALHSVRRDYLRSLGYKPAVFVEGCTYEDLLAARIEELEGLVAQVVVVEVGIDPTDGTRTIQYGAPRFSGPSDELTLTAEWFDGYGSAMRARKRFLEVLSASGSHRSRAYQLCSALDDFHPELKLRLIR